MSKTVFELALEDLRRAGFSLVRDEPLDGVSIVMVGGRRYTRAEVEAMWVDARNQERELLLKLCAFEFGSTYGWKMPPEIEAWWEANKQDAPPLFGGELP